MVILDVLLRNVVVPFNNCAVFDCAAERDLVSRSDRDKRRESFARNSNFYDHRLHCFLFLSVLARQAERSCRRRRLRNSLGPRLLCIPDKIRRRGRRPNLFGISSGQPHHVRRNLFASLTHWRNPAPGSRVRGFDRSFCTMSFALLSEVFASRQRQFDHRSVTDRSPLSIFGHAQGLIYFGLFFHSSILFRVPWRLASSGRSQPVLGNDIGVFRM